MTRWQRSVPVYGVPVFNRGFWGLLIVFADRCGIDRFPRSRRPGTHLRNVRPLRLGSLENL